MTKNRSFLFEPQVGGEGVPARTTPNRCDGVAAPSAEARPLSPRKKRLEAAKLGAAAD
jgi:hypothetical protein